MNTSRVMIVGGWIAACVLAGATAEEAERTPSRLEPGRLTVGAHGGDGVAAYSLDAMVPAWKPKGSLFLVNPRAVASDDDEEEASLGVVARRLWSDRKLILGANFYYDSRRTAEDNTFDQTGGGLEVLSPWVDARANYYLPLTEEKLVESFEVEQESVSGRTRTITTTLYHVYEEALEGYDAEVGVWLPYLSRHVPTAVYAGYYDFDSDHASHRVDGVRVRMEARPHPNVTLDAEWIEDEDLHGSDYWIGLRLHVPLDPWRGLRLDRRGESPSRIRPFSERLGEPVHRDNRVRTVLGAACAVSEVQRTESVGGSSSRRGTDVAPVGAAPVCYDYATLDDNGNVVIVTICE